MYGVITWPDGTPVANRTVTFNDPSGTAARLLLLQTDAHGDYRLTSDLGVQLVLMLSPQNTSNQLRCSLIYSDSDPAEPGQDCSVIFKPNPTDSQSGNPYYAAAPNGSQVNWIADTYLVNGTTQGNTFTAAESQAQQAGADQASAAETYFNDGGVGTHVKSLNLEDASPGAV